jgi:hypothetical protein
MAAGPTLLKQKKSGPSGFEIFGKTLPDVCRQREAKPVLNNAFGNSAVLPTVP